MSVRERLRAIVRVWIEDRLPWYDRVREAEHNARTERIRERSIRARIRAEGERDRVAMALKNMVDGVRGQ